MEENFVKHDGEKLEYHLLDPKTLERKVKMLQHGKKKYKENNWKLNKDINTWLNAIDRHMMEIKKGNMYDKESGMLHADAVQTNAMFLSYLIYEKIKKDKNGKE
jgi:hypothetical protein